jgi:lipopolysaccharide/colanic/teichoic acid biosynthesis glycosyltransferase
MTRFFDIFFSLAAIVFFSPLLLIIILILKLTGEGEIFYSQTRVGKNGVNFKVIKFATMLKNSENIGSGTVTVHNDPRILPLGKFLRNSKINELPQLLNILLGDMSIIGPRPQTQRCYDAFSKEVQSAISTVRPGLSGIGSIIFSKEEAMLKDVKSLEIYDEIIAPYKGDLEIWYTENNNLLNYFVLIISTIVAVIFGTTKFLNYLFPNLPVPSKQAKELLK